MMKQKVPVIFLCLELLVSCTIIHADRENTANPRFGRNLLWYGIDPLRTNQTALDSFSASFFGLDLEIARFDIYWGRVERDSKGNYDWSLTDDLLTTVSQNTAIIFTLYSCSEWGSGYNNIREQFPAVLGTGKCYNSPPSSVPVNMQDYMDIPGRKTAQKK